MDEREGGRRGWREGWMDGWTDGGDGEREGARVTREGERDGGTGWRVGQMDRWDAMERGIGCEGCRGMSRDVEGGMEEGDG